MKRMKLIIPCVLILGMLAVFPGFAGGTAEKTESVESAEGKLLPKPITIRWMTQEAENQPQLLDTPAIRGAFNKTNVKLVLEPVPEVGYEEKKKALLATAQIPDVIRVNAKDIQLFAASGIFLPVSDYMEHLPNFKRLIADRPDIDTLKVNGKLWGFPILEKWRIGVAPMPQIRMDLVEKLNLKVPTDFEELFTVLKRMKADNPDIVGVGGRKTVKYIFGQWAFPLGSGGFPGFTQNPMYYDPTDDKYFYSPAHPDFKIVVTYFNRLYREGLLDPEYVVSPWDTFIRKVTTGKIVFIWDNAVHGPIRYNPGLQKVDPNARFEMIKPLKNVKGQVRTYRYYRDWLQTSYAINAKVKDPVAVVKFIDWMYSDEGSDITNYGIEGETFEYVNGQPRILDSLFNEFKDKQDATHALNSYLGVGLQAWSVLVDEHKLVRISSPEVLENGKKIDKWTKEGLIQYMRYDPPFNEEEVEVIKKVQPKVDNIMEREINKFITGERPMSEYDSFRQELIKAGASGVERVYNEAYARIRSK